MRLSHLAVISMERARLPNLQDYLLRIFVGASSCAVVRQGSSESAHPAFRG